MKKMLLISVIAIAVFTFVIFFGKNVVERINNSPNIDQRIEQEIKNEEAILEPELSLEEKLWNQRIDAAFTTINCQQPAIQNFGENYYTGPLIDTHFHIANIPDGDPLYEESEDYENQNNPLLGVNTKITDVICTLEQENTKKVFAFFPVYPEIPKQMIEVVKKTMEKYPDKFVPFIMAPDHDDSPDGFPTVNAETLKEMLDVYHELFKGYGEIGLYARGDHGGPKGSPELPPDSQRLNEIYPIIRENNLVVYFHLGEGQKESFEKVLEQNPDIKFIWHGDQLISYEDGGQNLKNLDEILSNHKNVYYGIDELYGDIWLLKPEVNKEEFFKHFKNYKILLEKDLKTWKKFIEKHPDQVLWGTDRGGIALWSLDEDVGLTLTKYSRAFIARLAPEVQEKFAYKNAESLFGQ